MLVLDGVVVMHGGAQDRTGLLSLLQERVIEFKSVFTLTTACFLPPVCSFPGFDSLKPVRTPVAILGSLGVCIYVPASRHWLISYSPIHLT